METFVASVETGLWLEDVLAAFKLGKAQTPLIIDDEGHSREIPVELLPIFEQLADDFAHGRAVSLVSHEKMMTTQDAADFIGVSRPTLITLLGKYSIPFDTIGKHRRIAFSAVQSLKAQMKLEQRKALAEVIRLNQEAGMYDL